MIVHLETPSPFTPLGAKGLGEGNNMSTPVCIANAFADALRPVRGVLMPGHWTSPHRSIPGVRGLARPVRWAVTSSPKRCRN